MSKHDDMELDYIDQAAVDEGLPMPETKPPGYYLRLAEERERAYAEWHRSNRQCLFELFGDRADGASGQVSDALQGRLDAAAAKIELLKKR